MHELPHTRSCFVCGEANTSGLRLRFETDGEVVRSRFVPRPEHIGFREVVHGGLLSTVLDEVMVWACAVKTRRFAFCAELTVRFLHPARPGQVIVATGRLEADRKGRIYEAGGELADESGRLLATATGKYLPLKPAEAAEMVSDFVGDPGWFRSAAAEGTK